MDHSNQNPVEIQLLLDFRFAYPRNILLGAQAYRSNRRAFVIVDGTPQQQHSIGTQIDCPVVTMFADESAQRHALNSGLPIVNVSEMSDRMLLPRVVPDQQQVGRLAAEFLSRKGLKSFAFVGEHNRLFELRWQGFVSYLQAIHVTATRLEDPAAFLTYFASAPEKQLGVLAGNDFLARKIADGCAIEGWSIPGDFLLLGVDNDELVCSGKEPHLSSIETNGQRVGYEAIKLLDELLDGAPPPSLPILIPPLGVIERKSTNAFAAGDPQFIKAMRYIQEHACEGLTVETLASATRIPSRTLREKFKRHLNTTVRSEILRIQFAQARRLLAETNLKIEDIGTRCGHPHYGRFNNAFKKEAGMTPGLYRKMMQTPGISSD